MGPQTTGGQGRWEGPGAGSKLSSPRCASRAPPAQPRQGGSCARCRRALTSQGRSGRDGLSPGRDPDSDPQLQLGFCRRPPLRFPLGIQLWRLRRGSRGGGSAAPRALPARPAGANRRRGPPRTRPAGRPRTHAPRGPTPAQAAQATPLPCLVHPAVAALRPSLTTTPSDQGRAAPTPMTCNSVWMVQGNWGSGAGSGTCMRPWARSITCKVLPGTVQHPRCAGRWGKVPQAAACTVVPPRCER